MGYVGAGFSRRTRARNRSASGQAEAKAMRMRLALSPTRAATLSSRRRKVVNSALARAAVLCIACWMRHSIQYAAGCSIRRICLALAARHEDRSLARWDLWRIDWHVARQRAHTE